MELTFGIFHDGRIASLPVDSIGKAFDVGVRKHDIRIASSLRETFAKVHPAVREPPFETEDINQTSHHESLAKRIDQCDERVDTPIGIPDTVIRVVV